jgi:hypothetical protein
VEEGDQLVFGEVLGDLTEEEAPAGHGGTKRVSRGRGGRGGTGEKRRREER